MEGFLSQSLASLPTGGLRWTAVREEALVKVQAALIREQGVNFAVVVVKRHVLTATNQRETLRGQISQVFGGAPTVVMAQDAKGVPMYNGRRDLVGWLSNVYVESLPWKEYTLAG
jgi:hypothetical protein